MPPRHLREIEQIPTFDHEEAYRRRLDELAQRPIVSTYDDWREAWDAGLNPVFMPDLDRFEIPEFTPPDPTGVVDALGRFTEARQEAAQMGADAARREAARARRDLGGMFGAEIARMLLPGGYASRMPEAFDRMLQTRDAAGAAAVRAAQEARLAGAEGDLRQQQLIFDTDRDTERQQRDHDWKTTRAKIDAYLAQMPGFQALSNLRQRIEDQREQDERALAAFKQQEIAARLRMEAQDRIIRARQQQAQRAGREALFRYGNLQAAMDGLQVDLTRIARATQQLADVERRLAALPRGRNRLFGVRSEEQRNLERMKAELERTIHREVADLHENAASLRDRYREDVRGLDINDPTARVLRDAFHRIEHQLLTGIPRARINEEGQRVHPRPEEYVNWARNNRGLVGFMDFSGIDASRIPFTEEEFEYGARLVEEGFDESYINQRMDEIRRQRVGAELYFGGGGTGQVPQQTPGDVVEEVRQNVMDESVFGGGEAAAPERRSPAPPAAPQSRPTASPAGASPPRPRPATRTDTMGDAPVSEFGGELAGHRPGPVSPLPRTNQAGHIETVEHRLASAREALERSYAGVEALGGNRNNPPRATRRLEQEVERLENLLATLRQQ